MKYVDKHRLYMNALQLWKDSPQEYSVRSLLWFHALTDDRKGAHGAVWGLAI